MKQAIETWQTLETKEIADCRVFKVRENTMLSGAKTGNFYVIENPDWVNVIAVTKNAEVVLIEQFRHGIEEVILEIPGGMIDEGEAPEMAARRELLEETGFASENFVYLGKSRPNPAIQNNWLYHFAALDAEKTGEVKFDEHESISVQLFPYSEIEDLIGAEKITHSLVLAGFYKMDYWRRRK